MNFFEALEAIGNGKKIRPIEKEKRTLGWLYGSDTYDYLALVEKSKNIAKKEVTSAQIGAFRLNGEKILSCGLNFCYEDLYLNVFEIYKEESS